MCPSGFLPGCCRRAALRTLRWWMTGAVVARRNNWWRDEAQIGAPGFTQRSKVLTNVLNDAACLCKQRIDKGPGKGHIHPLLGSKRLLIRPLRARGDSGPCHAPECVWFLLKLCKHCLVDHLEIVRALQGCCMLCVCTWPACTTVDSARILTNGLGINKIHGKPQRPY
jgi:hypothetical protein